jgi:hypothetical protein
MERKLTLIIVRLAAGNFDYMEEGQTTWVLKALAPYFMSFPYQTTRFVTPYKVIHRAFQSGSLGPGKT